MAYSQSTFSGPQSWQAYTARSPSHHGGHVNNQSNYGPRRILYTPCFNSGHSVASNRGSFNPMQSSKNEPRQFWGDSSSSITSPQPKFFRLDCSGINRYPLTNFQPTYSDYSHGFNDRNYDQQSVSNFESSNMRGIPRGHNQIRRGRGFRNIPKEHGERNRKPSNRPSSGSRELSTTQLKILEILNKQPQSIAEFKVLKIEMMRVDGLEKKDVNHAIYDMQSRGLVKKINDVPPIWQAMTANDSVYSAASSVPTSFYRDNSVGRNNVITSSNNFTTEAQSLASDTYSEGHSLNNISEFNSDNLADSSNIHSHLSYAPNLTSSTSPLGLDRTVQEGHQGVRPSLGRGRAMSLFKKGTFKDFDRVGDFNSTNASKKSRADDSTECIQSTSIGPSNCISKRLQVLAEQPISQYDTRDRCQFNSQQLLTAESQFEDSVEDFTSVRNESVADSEHLRDFSLQYNNRVSSDYPSYPGQIQSSTQSFEEVAQFKNDNERKKIGDNAVSRSGHISSGLVSTTCHAIEGSQSLNTDTAVVTSVVVSSHSAAISATKAQDVSRSKLLTVSGSQSSGGFKIPLPPKQLLQVDPKFQTTPQIVRNMDHSNIKLVTALSSDDIRSFDTTPTFSLRETSCESSYTYPPISITGNEYHSLPVSFDSLKVREESINRDGVSVSDGGLQRCSSLQDASRINSKNPFAVALHLEDDDYDDDDIPNDLSSSSVTSYSRDSGSYSLPRSISYDQINSRSYEGLSNVCASHSGQSTSCSSTDSWDARGGILTSLVGFGGAGGTSGQSLTGESFAALNKNCISALMEYAQARKMEATIECIDSHGPSHKPKFKMAVFMGGRWFPYIVCTNKKEGKKEAADVALRTLMSEGTYQSTQSSASPFENLGQKATHFDNIARLAHQTFNRLAATVMESMVGKKVLGAFVMTTGPDDPGTVISIGTGNRCITGTFLSLEGQTVNDSHAEVISRRGLIRFLYRQLLSYTPGHSSTIFELSPTGKLKVKDGIKFHLYISTAPCGDGALFSPRDIGSVTCPETGGHTPTFANKLQGKLRTKMEGGEGTIPIDDQGGAQCWDGILRGERLRTMSCSDKVCRWNIVGLQGALLSHFIEPVYMASLTLGFLYDHGHLSRAVCCRLSNGEPDISTKLPQGYRINHPLLGRVTAYDPTREVQKTKELSVNWVHGDESVELTDGTKGICVSAAKNGQTSQVAKCSLFELYHRLCQRFNRTDLLQYHTYRHAKHQAIDFRTVNQLMCEKFKALGHGRWVTKPVEEEMFSWSGAV